MVSVPRLLLAFLPSDFLEPRSIAVFEDPLSDNLKAPRGGARLTSTAFSMRGLLKLCEDLDRLAKLKVVSLSIREQ
jgi:hypothetical protein